MRNYHHKSKIVSCSMQSISRLENIVHGNFLIDTFLSYTVMQAPLISHLNAASRSSRYMNFLRYIYKVLIERVSAFLCKLGAGLCKETSFMETTLLISDSTGTRCTCMQTLQIVVHISTSLVFLPRGPIRKPFVLQMLRDIATNTASVEFLVERSSSIESHL